MSPWVLAASTYTVLLVFAIYVGFPLSGLVAKPYWLLLAAVEKLVLWITS